MPYPSFYIRAWLYLAPLIPSVLITIFNLYHLLNSRALRTALNNHVIILLLLFGLLETLSDIVPSIYLFFNGIALSPTPAFCLAWLFIGSAALAASYILMAWASIERHILVFHPNFFAAKTKRYLFHYLPLAICIFWPTTFYFVAYFIMPCTFPYNYSVRQCSHSNCLGYISGGLLLDSITDLILPACVTSIFSMLLFLRVLHKRYRARGRIDWRNYRKMAAQLLPISALYICLLLPPAIMYAAYSAGLPKTVATNYYSCTSFLSYWVILFTPFATVISLPELKKKCQNLLFWRRRHVVQPEMMEMTRRNAGQTVAVVPIVKPVKIETTRRNVGQTVAVVPIVQPVMIETAHQNINQTVEALPVVQPVMIEMATQNVDQTVEGLPVVQPVIIETTHQNVDQTVEPLPPVVI
jgi:hypothetical protein